MKVTIRIDDELRAKPYWKNVQDSEEFEFIRERGEDGAILKDRQNRSVLCSLDRVIFPSNEVINKDKDDTVIPEPYGDGI